MSTENGGKDPLRTGNLLDLVNKIKHITDSLGEPHGIECLTFWEIQELRDLTERVRENYRIVYKKRIDDEGVVRPQWWGDYVYEDHPEAYHEEEGE
tara:strand:- start:53 stop:340 length:288 start_codon:yes stop_codon:yes gene_type:complete